MTDLLEIVDELTKPKVERVDSHRLEHESLFDQLRNAGSGRTSAGSNAGKHERSLVDLDALHMYAQYSAQVTDWCRMWGVVIRDPATGLLDRNPSHGLRAWYKATLSDNTFTETAANAYQRILSRWATAIRDHFDPPKWEDSNLPCPACGARYYGDAVNGGGNAIRMTFRVDDDGRVHDERALCRACNLVWVGRGAIEELADEQHEKAG